MPSRVEIDGQFIEPSFGLTDTGKLIDITSLTLWDPKTGAWRSPPDGITLAFFMDARPIS